MVNIISFTSRHVIYNAKTLSQISQIKKTPAVNPGAF